MPNSYFNFKQFTIHQDKCAMKICTDSCLFGAVIEISSTQSNILDIGTGTGLLSLMCAQKTDNRTFIDAIEIETNSFLQAKENIANSVWKNRINIYKGNFFEYDFKKKYDLIICNPPFFQNQYHSNKKEDYLARHNNEFDFVKLLSKSHKISTAEAILFLLLPYYSLNEWRSLIHQSEWNINQIYHIYNKKENKAIRFILILAKKKDNVIEKDIIIYKEDNTYTDQFKELLKEYYLE